MRICAFTHCSKSTYTLNRWRKQLCSQHNQRHGMCSCAAPFSLFPFPTEKKNLNSRFEWARAVYRRNTAGKNWTPSPDDRICSDHFVDGKPTPGNPNPTINLGHRDNLPASRKPPKERSLSRSASATKQLACELPADDGPSTGHDHCYSYRCNCSTECDCVGCATKDATVKELQFRYDELKESSAKEDLGLSTKSENVSGRYLKSDEKVNTYTGLPSLSAFDDLVQLITPVASNMQYWRGSQKYIPRQEILQSKSGPARKLSVHEELVMVLMKLRLGLINELLGDMFGVSSSSVSQIFNTYARMLSKVVKPLIFWPPKERIHEHLPKDMEKYPNLRVTIDCTEVFIERPRHLDLQAQTWSDYKKHNTVKVLIGISPNGAITFLSKAWGGRTSDKKITCDSGFLDLLDHRDLVMADRGFPIQEDLLLRGAKLLIPPPSSGMDQMIRSQVQKTKAVANARIHVERAIGRMKRYSILTGTLPISLVPLVDDIFIVCAALCNLHPPLVN